jgi:hypothetical protein
MTELPHSVTLPFESRRYARLVDEARRVIERLDRIDRLRDDGATPRVLLEEVRWLLSEGEEWLAAERAQRGAGGARDAELDRARVALDRSRASLAGDVTPQRSGKGVVVAIAD